MANVYDMIDTWNDGATTFTSIKMDVTDTASNASSLLMDLQVGGASKFSVSKSAGAVFGENLIEQRNSTNAQTFNLYNTYTDTSNYERGFMKWDSNVLKIGTESAGTGTVRNVALTSGGVLSTTGQSLYITYASSYEIRLYEGPNIRWRFASTIFRPEVNNTNDIGYDGIRIRTLYAGTSVKTPRLEVDSDFTVSTLPGTPAVGMIARVTDATAPAVGSTVTGGGSTAALVWYNGTSWTVIGTEDQTMVKSDTTQAGTGSVATSNIVTISQTDYDAIVTPDSNTIYFITG